MIRRNLIVTLSLTVLIALCVWSQVTLFAERSLYISTYDLSEVVYKSYRIPFTTIIFSKQKISSTPSVLMEGLAADGFESLRSNKERFILVSTRAAGTPDQRSLFFRFVLRKQEELLAWYLNSKPESETILRNAIEDVRSAQSSRQLDEIAWRLTAERFRTSN